MKILLLNFKFLSLTSKLILSIFIIGILITFFIVFISYQSSRNTLEMQITRDIELIAESNEGHILEFLEGIKKRTEDFSSDGYIREEVQKIISKKATPSALNTHLVTNKKDLEPTIVGINIYDLNGRVISSTLDGEIGLLEADDEYVKKAKDLNYGEAFVGDIYLTSHFNYKEPILVSSAPIFTNDKLKKIGVIAKYTSLEQLNDVISGQRQINLGATSGFKLKPGSLEVILINKDGMMISQSKFIKESILKLKIDTVTVRNCRVGKETSGIFQDYRDVEVVGASMCFKNGWVLVAKINSDEAFAAVNTTRNTLILLSSVTIPVLLLIIFYVITVALEKEKEKFRKQAIETRKFAKAVEGASDQIIISDPEGIVLYANPTLEKITGFSPKEALGKKAASLWGGLMDKKFYEDLWETIKIKKQPFKGELKNKRKSGQEYFVSLTISPILNERGDIEYFVGIERDISKEHEIDKMKTEFVSLASHELRTPLGIIKWYLEAFQLEGFGKGLPKQANEYLEEVHSSNERLINIVKDLLNVSRIDQGRSLNAPQLVDVKPICQRIVQDFKIKAKTKEINISLNIPKALPKIMVDQKHLDEVIQNLVINAVNYSKKGGNVEISIEKDNQELTFSVKDSGIGISNSDKEKIFKKFFRSEQAVKSNTNGTGLGLYIVKSYVESWGGKIWFESKEGEGSNFHFTLPFKK